MATPSLAISAGLAPVVAERGRECVWPPWEDRIPQTGRGTYSMSLLLCHSSVNVCLMNC